MYIDKELELTTAVALDLGPKKPGPGKPIKMVALGVTTTVVITHGVALGSEAALMTIDALGADLVEFELPSSTLQFIIATFADGEVKIVMDAQTNE